MSGQQPEFSRMVKLDEIGRIDWPVRAEASEEERQALARRFALFELASLAADYSLEREPMAVIATGTIRASLSQPCVATGEPVEETVEEDFTIRFVPESSAAASHAAEEIEIDAEECDTLPYSGDRIDIGEAIAETLALAINPYPRSANAERYLREAGVLTEEQAGPFAALASLRKKRED